MHTPIWILKKKKEEQKLILKCGLKTQIFDNSTIYKLSTSKNSNRYIVSSSTIIKIHIRVTTPCSNSIPLYSHNVVHTSFSSGILEPYQKNTILSHYQTKAPTSVKTNLRSYWWIMKKKKPIKEEQKVKYPYTFIIKNRNDIASTKKNITEV